MNRPVQRVSFALVTLLLLAVAGTSVADASQKSYLRTQPMAVGVSMDDSTNMNAVDGFASSVGRNPAIWALWSSWGGSDSAFPTAAVQGLNSRGIVPMINWSPVGNDQTDCTNWSLAATIRGDHDAYIRSWAQAAKDSGARIVLRYAPELNGYWYVWGPGRCTNGTGKKMKAAWKHVWNIFRGPGGVGATNVQFLWSVFGTYRLKAHYPGDAYVDYLGFTAFNWNQVGHPAWKSMVGTMKPTMNSLRYYISKTKPIIVAEMGAGYDPSHCSSCDKAAYIRTGYPAVFTKWPQIVGMVYFNIDSRPVQQPDWRLNSPAGALTAYQGIVADARFQGQLP